MGCMMCGESIEGMFVVSEQRPVDNLPARRKKGGREYVQYIEATNVKM